MRAPTACIGRHADPDGRRRGPSPIRHLRAGDRIYGTERRGALPPLRPHARCSTTGWSRKPRVPASTSENGTELITSGDHRFLTRARLEARDGRRAGPLQRPHLTPNDKLHGHRRRRAEGRSQSARLQARLPLRGDPRRRSSLDSAIRDDDGRTERAEPLPPRARRLRGARPRAGLPRGRRCRDRRASGSAAAHAALPRGPGDPHRPARSIARDPRAHRVAGRAQRRWYKGFLAGIFDAEGNFSGSGCIRSATRIRRSSTGRRSRAAGFGLAFVVERAAGDGEMERAHPRRASSSSCASST